MAAWGGIVLIVIISNRSVETSADDHTVFGDKANAKGLHELRVATAVYDEVERRWRVELLREQKRDIAAGRPPSKQLFNNVLSQIADGSLSEHWVFFVHGFNQSFLENLEKCREIERLYGVNVLAFSWPSNQGGIITNEYQKARGAAKQSSSALDRALEKLADNLKTRPFRADCNVQLTLMVYSLGAYLLENYIRSPVFAGETEIFNNVVLTQADVDAETHASWIDSMSVGKRLYVTINEFDQVLKWSDLPNPPRLGNSVDFLNSRRAIYFDFTDGRNVGDTHGIFYKTVKKNTVVRNIFHAALRGRRPERLSGIEFNASINAFELSDKVEFADLDTDPE